jgi:hypothetical protein
MITFKQFLSERALLTSPKETLENVENILKNLDQLKGQPLLWRGFKTKDYKDGLVIVNNNRTEFYGGIYPKSKEIIKELKIKNIAFCTTSLALSNLYGTPLIFVPLSKMTPYHSDKVSDIMVAGQMDVAPKNKEEEYYQKSSAKELAKTYKKEIKSKHEIIIDVEKYILIDPIKILQIVPQWIEKKMGYSKFITVTPEEKQDAFNFRYNKDKVTDEEKARTAARKQDAKFSARGGMTTPSTIEFQFNSKLETYADLYKYMSLFKSYLEFMVNRENN